MNAKPMTLDLGPFAPGMDNRRPEFKMKGGREDSGDFLRSAVNVDISEDGTIKRRPGFASALSGTDCHSLWADGDDVFRVDGQVLQRITGLPGNANAASVVTGLAPGRPVSYARTPSAVYYSNGEVIGRIRTTGALGVSTPPVAIPPAAVASAGGALTAGRYGLCFSYLDAVGEEGPATAPIWVDSPASGVISISRLPTTFPTGVSSIVCYVTHPNDPVLQRLFVMSAAVATRAVAVLPALGARCQTVLFSPMPAGDIVRLHNARLLSAIGNTLTYSEPFMLGLHNPAKNFIQFPGAITVVETTNDGVWICAGETYWFDGGDIAAAQPAVKAAFDGVPGSGGRVPNSTDVFWMSARGMMRGTTSGELTNMQEQHVAVAPSAFAAGAFRETDGRKQFYESTFADETNRLAATSYMTAEIVRRKVSL